MIELGFLIGFSLTALIGITVWLIRNSKSAHERNHRFHSELMCDYCRERTRTDPRRAWERWPMRVMGCEPPRGTG